MKKLISIIAAAAMLTACGNQAAETESGQPAVQAKQSVSEPATESASEEVSETAETSAQADDADVIKDINLRADKKELTAHKNENGLIFYAEVPVDASPEKLILVDADTGRTAAELFDEADYEKYGDTIKGDSVYNCRYTVDDDINEDPDVSAEKHYHFYAQFEDEKGVHRSETIEISVYEQFTDKELGDMEEVNKVLTGMTNSEEYKALTVEQRKERALEVLNTLAENGTKERPYSLIIKESIYAGDDMISFEYACGVYGGTMLKDFDPDCN